MNNQIGMVVCYSPTGRKPKGKRFGLMGQWRLWNRRRQSCDLANLKGWW